MAMSLEEVEEKMKDTTLISALTTAYDVKHTSMHPLFVDRVFKVWDLEDGKVRILDSYVVTGITANGATGLTATLKSEIGGVLEVTHKWVKVGKYPIVVRLPINCETKITGVYVNGEAKLSFSMPILVGVKNNPKFCSKKDVWFDPINRIKIFHPDNHINL